MNACLGAGPVIRLGCGNLEPELAVRAEAHELQHIAANPAIDQCGSLLPLPVRTGRAERCGVSGGSIAQVDVDLLQEPAAGFEAADVGGHLGCELGDGGAARDVRHDRYLGMQPERALGRQGLGP